MSFQITTALKRDFESNVYHLAQAKKDMSSYARQGTMNAEGKFIDRVGTVEMRERTDRHSRVTYNETPHSRRYVTPQEFYVSDLVDEADKLQTLQDPAAEYTIEFVNAMRRKKTTVFLAALLGAAKVGKTGADTPVALPADNKDTTATPFSYTKVLGTRRKFANADVDLEEEMPHFAISPSGLEDLLLEATLTETSSGTSRGHADYMTTRDLQTGTINTAWGFRWHPTTQVPFRSGSTTIKECIAWCPSGAAMVFNREGFTSIDRIPELHYSWQVYVSFMGGAIRMEEAKVQQVDVTNN